MLNIFRKGFQGPTPDGPPICRSPLFELFAVGFYPTVQFYTYRMVNTVVDLKTLRDILTQIMCILPVAIFGCVITCE